MEHNTDRILWTVLVLAIGVALYVSFKPAANGLLGQTTEKIQTIVGSVNDHASDSSSNNSSSSSSDNSSSSSSDNSSSSSSDNSSSNTAVGTNLLTGTGDHTFKNTGAWDKSYLSNENTNDLLTLFKSLEGQTVTVSVDYKYSGFVAGSGYNRLGWEMQIDVNKSYLGVWYSPTNDSGSGRMSTTFVVPKNITSIDGAGYIEFSGSGTGTLSHLKIEKGTTATPWMS